MENEDNERCCGNCISFTDEDAIGVGWCDKKNKPRSCYQFCKEHKLRQEREVNMKEEYIAQIAKELKEVFGWMQDSSAVNADTLDELIEDSGDIYEVIVDIHLKNGDVVSLNNDCIGGFEKKEYTGAHLGCDFSDGNIMAIIFSYVPTYRVFKIPLTSICWIGAYSKEINWKEYKLKKENSGKINKGNE